MKRVQHNSHIATSPHRNGCANGNGNGIVLQTTQNVAQIKIEHNNQCDMLLQSLSISAGSVSQRFQRVQMDQADDGDTSGVVNEFHRKIKGNL